MADQANTDQANTHQATDRYAALERLYSERRWAEVEASAEVLLSEMDGAVDRQGDGAGDGDLRSRLLLLLGHIRLYGFNDPGVAAEHYRQVLAAEPEVLLLGIAQEGLNQCLAVEEPSPSDAMPWLEQVAVPEVAASGTNSPAPPSSPALASSPVPDADKEPLQSFPGFVQPVETFESVDNNEIPTEIMESTDQPTQPTQLSPKESAELAKGLLSVVIRPN
jgi:hypothetical protein